MQARASAYLEDENGCPALSDSERSTHHPIMVGGLRYDGLCFESQRRQEVESAMLGM